MEVGFIIAIVVLAVVISVAQRKSDKPSVSKPTPPKSTVKPAPKPKTTETPIADRGGFNGLNKSALSRMTKSSLENYAKGRFGVDLDRRLTKDKLIAEILKLEEKKDNG